MLSELSRQVRQQSSWEVGSKKPPQMPVVLLPIGKYVPWGDRATSQPFMISGALGGGRPTCPFPSEAGWGTGEPEQRLGWGLPLGPSPPLWAGGTRPSPASFSTCRAEGLVPCGLPHETLGWDRGQLQGPVFPVADRSQEAKPPAGPTYLTDCRRDCRPSEETTVG